MRAVPSELAASLPSPSSPTASPPPTAPHAALKRSTSRGTTTTNTVSSVPEICSSVSLAALKTPRFSPT